MDVKVIAKKTIKTLATDGPIVTLKKGKGFIEKAKVNRQYEGKQNSDILFINGCDYNLLPHPPRYRVKHQMEQLKANGMSCTEVFYLNLDFEYVRNHRVFIFYRCPYTETIGEVIRKAKELNKTVIYDIDDLVIDTKYTDTIKYLDTMSNSERIGYDQGVRDMQKVLTMCDAAITTTETLAEELSHYVPEVFINRNTASEEMLKLSQRALNSREERTDDKVKMAYFSGSITHNDDFILIQPTVIKLMEEFENLELHVVGILDIPDELEAFKERIITHPFMNWKKLPALIASIDINLAPLEESVFNEAKSENKWVEAALVDVPTVASNLGAFKKMMKHNETGMLCTTEDEWYQSLKQLIESQEERKRIAHNAHQYCERHCATLYTGFPLKRFLKQKMHSNVLLILPALSISGGIMVAFEHCVMFREKGYDVTIMNDDFDHSTWCSYAGFDFPVYPSKDMIFLGSFDRAIATMWSTVKTMNSLLNVEKKYYLVQNYETNFYEPGDHLRLEANETYSASEDVKYVTISKWCEEWLWEDYDKHSKYAPNGIHKKRFANKKRTFDGKKIRVLIEGDCGVYYKNVDESFKVVEKLDPDKFEVWYMSYNAKPKDSYRVDKFLHKVPYEKVPQIYQQCDILLKTSFLESFSYPPLEMMATGGYAVVVPNGGNKEYLVDEKNCLLYPLGEIDKAVEAINRICNDAELRDRLYQGGVKTAEDRDWNSIVPQILALYDIDAE